MIKTLFHLIVVFISILGSTVFAHDDKTISVVAKISFGDDTPTIATLITNDGTPALVHDNNLSIEIIPYIENKDIIKISAKVTRSTLSSSPSTTEAAVLVKNGQLAEVEEINNKTGETVKIALTPKIL